MRELTPRQIVAELDKYIVGQDDAKRAVAIAIRNRWRRQQLADEMRSEVTPKNIIMIGPTGVGKTEIARRLARLTGAPFIKVEATKYTEVGYLRPRRREHDPRPRRHRHRASSASRNVKGVADEATAASRSASSISSSPALRRSRRRRARSRERHQRTREKLREHARRRRARRPPVEITVEQRPPAVMLSSLGMEQMDLDLQDMFEKIIPKQTSRRELPVREARQVLFEQETDAAHRPGQSQRDRHRSGRKPRHRLHRRDRQDRGRRRQPTAPTSRARASSATCCPSSKAPPSPPATARCETDHILFIAAGAFHLAKPCDLMPELQGRFPIRVELKDLTKDDFVRILTEPQKRPHQAVRGPAGTEGVQLVFTPTPSTPWPDTPTRSTRPPRTSAPAASTPSSSGS